MFVVVWLAILGCTPAEPDLPWVLRLDRPAGPADRARLEDAGLEVLGARSPDGWLVRGPRQLAPRGATATSLTAAERIGPNLTRLAGHEGPVAVVVGLHPGADADAVLDVAAHHRLDAPGRSADRVVLTGDAADVAAARDALAAVPGVAWVIRRQPRRLLNTQAASIGQAGLGAAGATPLFDAGLLGQGQIGAVLDSGVDADHCAFDDPAHGLPLTGGPADTAVDAGHRKLIAVDFWWDEEDPADPLAWDTLGHGTHVAATLAGDAGVAGVWEPGDGMAPAATLVIQDGGYVDNPLCTDLVALDCPVTNLDAVLDQAPAQGARGHSNTWGDVQGLDDAAIYTDATMDLDAYVWDHPDLLVVFAAGNSGPDDNTVGNPATAKNCLAVAASLNGPASGALASFSSRGPTNDGRIKPEVAFPGQGVTSAASDGDVSAPSCETRSLSGTSMATPGVAGMALLVRQYFVDGYYPDGAPDPARSLAPSAALVKAVLVHSAAPMEDELDPIPSTGQGWGRVLLADALPLSGSARALYIDDGRQLAEPDEEATWQVELPFDAERLKLTLAWSDWPSSPEATVHLVHDLDLVVTAPDGTTYLGNAFTGGVSDPTVADADRLNNLEQVLVPEPAAGTWTITARAHALPMAAQPFALVMTGSLGAVTPPADPDPPDTGDTADTSDTAPAHTGDTARETGEPDSESEDTAPLDSDPDPIDSAPPDPPAPDTATGKAGCGCGGTPPVGALAVALALFATARRRRIIRRDHPDGPELPRV